MGKKLISCMLTICMILTMLPTMAWAEEANVLDIAKGSITITDAGWTQGTATGTDLDVTITGTSTENTITVESGEHTITLAGVDMSANISKPLIDLQVDTKILLADSTTNTLTQGTADLPAINVRNGVTLTIDGTGSVAATAGNNAAGIGGGHNNNAGKAFNNGNATWGSIVIAGGTVTSIGKGVAGGLGGGNGGYATAVTINGGVVTASSTGNSGATGIRANAVTITGGEVTAIGKKAGIAKSNTEGTAFSMSGGTLVSVEGVTPVNAATTNITGGNVNGYCSGTNAKLYFTDAETGEALANTEVTINGWTAKTNSNGVIDTYLATVTDGTKVNATVGETAMEATLKDGVGLFGATCVCDTTPGTIAWEGIVDNVTLYEGVDSRVFEISAKYVAGSSCKAPTHGAYETVIISGNSVNADYADGKLTVNKAAADYAVTLTATAGGSVTDTKTITVKSIDKKGFDITAGTITFDGTKYTQGIEEYTPAADEQVVVYGSGTTDNSSKYLEVIAGTANVLLDNVNLNNPQGGGNDDANGMIRVKGGTLNLTLQGENTFTRNRGGLIFVGSVTDPTNAGAAVLNIDCAEGSDCTNENCPHTLTLVSGATRSAIIGGARKFDVNGNGSTGDEGEEHVDMSGTITINGGKIIIPNAFACGIGTPDAGGAYHYDININGGSVDIDDVNNQGVGIGKGRGGESSTVNINLLGGVVDVQAVGSKNETAAIGAGSNYSGTDTLVNITIGKENAASDDEPIVNATIIPKDHVAGETYGVAIGKSGNSSSNITIKIHSGTVNATGQIAIGFSLGGSHSTSDENNVHDLLITGGNITAEGFDIGIGAGGPAARDTITEEASERPMDVTIEISGDAKVNATGGILAIGMTGMGINNTAEIEISDTAEVTATATGIRGVMGTYSNPVAVGTIVGGAASVYDNFPAAGSTSIAITSPSVTVQAKNPIAASTETALEEGTTYTIKTEDGALTVEIPEGASGTVSDSSVTLPKGTELTDESGKKATVAEEVTVAAEQTNNLDVADDAVSLPAGSTVTKADGSSVNLSEGGTMAADGTITAGGTVTTKDAQGNVVSTVVVPEGEDATVSADGTVTAPAGTTIKQEGKDDVVLDNGGTVDKDGAVIETPVTPPADDEGDKPTPQPPYSGYYPSYTPSVTPAAPSVDSSSLNNAALAVGSAIKDGSAEFTPVNGYTKDEVLQLQKDGKLRMGIEKKSGYGSVAEKNLADAAIKSAGGAVSGVDVMYFDITPVLKLDNGTVVAHVTNTEKAITITIELSDELTKAAKDGKQIAVVRVHDGKAEFLSAKLNSAKTKVTFSSADFSTYAVVALNKATSAKTFDAGVAMYVGMAVLAATGSAVVIGKKRK